MRPRQVLRAGATPFRLDFGRGRMSGAAALRERAVASMATGRANRAIVYLLLRGTWRQVSQAYERRQAETPRASFGRSGGDAGSPSARALRARFIARYPRWRRAPSPTANS